MVASSIAPLWLRMIYITMEIFIGFFATVGNVLVIWVVKLNPSLQTTTFYFIVSLALADIAVGLLVIPVAIVVSLGIEMFFYSCLLMTSVLLSFTHASIMSLLAIAIDRYLRVKLTISSRIPEITRVFQSFQWKVPFIRLMGLFILLSLALFSDAMVMDEKVKASFVLDTASAVCNYDAQYKHHTKYWCRGYFRDYCTIIAFTPNSTNRVALTDTGSQLIVTVSCLTKEDMGWYWCGIQRDFARDDMDFTELIVNDNTEGDANDFWSGKDPSIQRNRSCRASKIVHKADRSRMSILIICILITGLGIISITSHLSKRRRTQRNRRVVTGKVLSRSSQINQASVIPTPLLLPQIQYWKPML
ncbi:adenosine receptor A3 isoform X8 [Dipodomys spectabilis]|uniref:adenosine receptor A3 isoform X8 n=2 Tax=Dipodomys spectabilis TaxID=105255 RepID=UPI001C5369CB|nr:adenosine receptor A3 isoform X8 [Dipodomys spectabilis]